MSRKPIEPGCTAIVVGGRCQENYGKIVKCVRRVGRVWASKKGFPFGDHDLWEVDKDIVFSDMFSGCRELYPYASESTLQRLDDNDEDELTEQLIEEEDYV